MKIDMNEPRDILADAIEALEALDGIEYDADTGTKRRDVAPINRKLLNLADDLALASALVRNEYWRGRNGISTGERQA